MHVVRIFGIGLGPLKTEPKLDMKHVLIIIRTRKLGPDMVEPKPDIFGSSRIMYFVYANPLTALDGGNCNFGQRKKVGFRIIVLKK